MSNDERAITVSTFRAQENHPEEEDFRDIHALTSPHPQRAHSNWETRSSSLSSIEGTSSSEHFSTMSREFNALVLAGSTIANNGSTDVEANGGGGNNLRRIGEDEEDMNPLAIVRDPMMNQPMDPVPSPRRTTSNNSLVVGSTTRNELVEDVTVHQVKKNEVESKIDAWQTAKISKVNNRFKREDAIIHGWEGEEVQKATTWMKKVERKLEEKRAKALEKMQNDIAKAHRKAEEKRASAEAKRGTKVARVLEIANLMRTLGRPPTKRSLF
ncbi:hypothetical protein ACHQM5_019007 [Ranunculus cassubicifolius]